MVVLLHKTFVLMPLKILMLKLLCFLGEKNLDFPPEREENLNFRPEEKVLIFVL